MSLRCKGGEEVHIRATALSTSSSSFVGCGAWISLFHRGRRLKIFVTGERIERSLEPPKGPVLPLDDPGVIIYTTPQLSIIANSSGNWVIGEYFILFSASRNKSSIFLRSFS